TITVRAIPGASRVDDAGLHAAIDDFPFARTSCPAHDAECRLPDTRGHHLHRPLPRGFIADDFLPRLARTDRTAIKTHGGIELQSSAPGGGFGANEHHADLHADLVNENDHAVRALDRGGELAQSLAHKTRLQPSQGVAHVAFDFSLRG